MPLPKQSPKQPQLFRINIPHSFLILRHPDILDLYPQATIMQSLLIQTGHYLFHYRSFRQKTTLNCPASDYSLMKSTLTSAS
jgi:hypothetical protein